MEPSASEEQLAHRQLDQLHLAQRAERLTALAAETRTSAVLLGASLGSMALFAAVLLLLTSWLAGH
jgi:hypothetical protein